MCEVLKGKVLEVLREEQMVMVSTCSAYQPRIRPMTLIFNQNRFFFATGSHDNKVQEIKQNPNTEICLLIKGDNCTGYIRAAGILNAVENDSIRKHIYEEASFLRNYWKDYNDKDFILYQMKWEAVEFLNPGENLATKFTW